MDIEFIKWLYDKADGFSLRSESDIDIFDFSINVPLPNTFLQSWTNHFRSDHWKHLYYPLLLQRAIEGVNNGTNFLIIQQWAVIKIGTYPKFSEWKTIQFCNYDSIDQAKESALKYIYEQETK